VRAGVASQVASDRASPSVATQSPGRRASRDRSAAEGLGATGA